MQISRIAVFAAVVVVSMLSPSRALAQSVLESFTTAYRSDWNGYYHSTTYEFTPPEPPEPPQGRWSAFTLSEFTVKVYYNSRQVWLPQGVLQCKRPADAAWTTWGMMAVDNHMGTLTVNVAASDTHRCRVILNFANNPATGNLNTSRQAAMRMSVSVAFAQTLNKAANPRTFHYARPPDMR